MPMAAKIGGTFGKMVAIRNCLVFGVTKCESRVELRAVLLSCPTKDSGCDDDDPLSLAMTAEETLILQGNNKNFQALKEEKEKGFPNAVKDCKRKLIITLKIKNAGKIPCDDEYIVIDHVFDPVTGGKGRLLSPVVLKLRQEQMIQLYGLQFQRVVNSDPFEEEKEAEKVCSVNPDNPTCGIAMYNGKPIPFSEGFCCSCDPKLNAKRQLSPISHGDSLLYQDSKLISQRNDHFAPENLISNAIINPNLVKLQVSSSSNDDYNNEKNEDKETTNDSKCPIKGLSPDKIPNYLMEHDHKIICRKEDFLNELCRLQDEKSKESTDIFNYGSSNSFDAAAISDGENLNLGVNMDSVNKKKFNSHISNINEKTKFGTTLPNLALITSSYDETNKNANNTEVLKTLLNALVTSKDKYYKVKLSDNVRGKRENQREHNLSLPEKKLSLQDKLNKFADSKNLVTSRRKRLLQISHKRFRKVEVPYKTGTECNAVMSVKVVQGDKAAKPTLPEFFFYNDRNIISPNEPSVLICNSTCKPPVPSDVEYDSVSNNGKTETSFTLPINVHKDLGGKYVKSSNYALNSIKKINENSFLDDVRTRRKQNNLDKIKSGSEDFRKIENNLQRGKIGVKNKNTENLGEVTTQGSLDWNKKYIKMNNDISEKGRKINSEETSGNVERRSKKIKILLNSEVYNSKATSLRGENLNNLYPSTEFIKNIKPTETPLLLKSNLEKQETKYFDWHNNLANNDDSSLLFTAKYEKPLKEKVYREQNKEAKMFKLPKEEKNNEEIDPISPGELRYIENEKKEPDYFSRVEKLQADLKENNYQNLKAKNSKITKKVKLKNCQEHSHFKNEELGQKKCFKFSSTSKIQGERKHIYPLQQSFKEEPIKRFDVNLKEITKKGTDLNYQQFYSPKEEFQALNIRPETLMKENIKTKDVGGVTGTDREKLQQKQFIYRPKLSYEIPEQYFIFRGSKNEYPHYYENPEASELSYGGLNYLNQLLKKEPEFTMKNNEKYRMLHGKEYIRRYNGERIKIQSPQKILKRFSTNDGILDPELKNPRNGFHINLEKSPFLSGLGDSKNIRVKRTVTQCSFEPARGFFGSELQFVEVEDLEKGRKEFKDRQIVHELEKCSSRLKDWPKAKVNGNINLISNTEFPEKTNHYVEPNTKSDEILQGKNRERLSRSYLNAPDYVVKKQKSIVKKKRGASDQIKESKITSRNKENCKKNSDLEGNSEDTAHCMRFGDLWYSVYLIKKPVVSQIVGIQLFDKHARCDGSTQWRDLTKGKMVRIGTFLPKAEDELPTISTTFLGGKTKKFESAIDPDNYLLLIPSHLSDPSKASYYPQVDGGPAEYLVVESKDVSSGGDCNMIGTSFEAFVRQPNRCSQPKGSCLKRQPIDLWREDMKARIRGKRGKYFVENFGTVSNSPIKTYTNFSGEFLALEYYGDYTSTIEIEVKADFNAIVRKGSNAQIPTVYVDGTYPKKTRIILSVLNIGLTSSYFRPRLGDCPPNLDPAWCPLEGPLVTIPPHQRHDFRLDLSGALPPNKILVTVQVLNQLNKKIAYRKIVIKKGDRCICAFHCKCNCIGRLKEGRICDKLPVEDYRGAGYVGPFPFREGAAPTSSESIRGNFKIILLTASYVLLILGGIKGILGILVRRMGIAGTRVIVGPRKILKYYERELECCSVLFDECGFPVHPTTCLPVQIVPLGLWFFFLSLPCFTSFCEGCEVCCRQEGNYDYDKKSSHPLLPQNIQPKCVNYTTTTFSGRKGKADDYLPYLPYKGDDDPLEEVDTEFVLQEMKKFRKN